MNSVKSVKSDKWVAAILVRPVGTNLGAEITGVDLTRPLDAKTVAAIADAKEGREKLRYFEKIYPHRRLMERVTMGGDRPRADPAELRRYLMPPITDFANTRRKRQNH